MEENEHDLAYIPGMGLLDVTERIIVIEVSRGNVTEIENQSDKGELAVFWRSDIDAESQHRKACQSRQEVKSHAQINVSLPP